MRMSVAVGMRFLYSADPGVRPGCLGTSRAISIMRLRFVGNSFASGVPSSFRIVTRTRPRCQKSRG